MEPLYGSKLKIRRAKSKIDELIRLEDSFRQDSSYRLVRSEFNPESGEYVYRIIGSSPLIPEQWSIYIGEIAHNLRSALNYSIYQLALLNTVPETVASSKILQFPIFDSPADFRKKGKRMIRLLKPEHQTLIEGLQPYEGRYEYYSLIWLEEINNADKHRLIQVVAARNAQPNVLSHWGDGHHFSTVSGLVELKEGAIFIHASPHVNVNENVIPQIAFRYGCSEVRGYSVTRVFSKIYIRVSDIIEDISRFF
jgi:hypothetical protein